MIKVVDITVKKYRIVCLVHVSPDSKYSSQSIAQAVLAEMPTLADHKCKNAAHQPFDKVLEHTSIPHVLEHMIIDTQVKKMVEAGIEYPKPLFGTTEWIDEDAGTAKIELTYADDLIALGAIKESQELLNRLFALFAS